MMGVVAETSCAGGRDNFIARYEAIMDCSGIQADRNRQGRTKDVGLGCGT